MVIIGSHLIAASKDTHNIVACLDSCEGLVDFTVVAVDSRPESDEIYNLIKDRKNLVAVRQVWPNSFADARNDALNLLLEHCPNVNYITWMDADDRWGGVDVSISHKEIRERLEIFKPEAINNKYIYAEDQGNPSLAYYRLRMFAHEPGHPLEYDWEGSAHESLMCRKSSGRPTLTWDDWVLVHHRGPNPNWRDKTERNMKMLELDIQKNPGNLRTQFYLAREYKDFGENEKAIVAFTKYINKSSFLLEKYQALLDIGYLYFWREDLDSAEERARQAITICPEVAFAYTLLGEIYMKKDRSDLARMYFAQAVFAPHGPVLFDNIPARTFGAHRWLAVACQYSNMYDESVYHHMIAKKMAVGDTGIRYNDSWLIDNSREFPEELNHLVAFDTNFNQEVSDENEFVRKLLNGSSLDQDIINGLVSNVPIAVSKIRTIFVNKELTDEILDSTKDILQDESPVAIIIRNFGNWGIKSIVGRYLIKNSNVELYRNYEFFRKNPNIDKNQGVGILIRT